MTQEKHMIRIFSEELNNRMGEFRISDRDLALYCHISETNIPGYRNGDRVPNLWCLVLIAERFECSVNDLLGFYETKCVSDFNSMKASDTFSVRNPFEDYLSKRILHRMTSMHVDIETLSDLSGVSLATIKCWIGNHPRLPRTIQFLRICDVLDCIPSDLLGY